MAYFIRYTETPQEDLERGCSYHLADVPAEGYEWNDYFRCYAQELEGLCAFELDAETEEEAIEEAEEFGFGAIFSSEMDSYCVLQGQFIDTCPEGCVIRANKIIHTQKY